MPRIRELIEENKLVIEAGASFSEIAQDLVDRCMARQAELVAEFLVAVVAETGLKPMDLELHQALGADGHIRFWFEKRDNWTARRPGDA